MTDRELLQDALDALEAALSDDKPYISRSKEAVEALRARLATCDRCEWVGLTDDEIAEAGKLFIEGNRMLPFSLARAIEAKLKEKNN